MSRERFRAGKRLLAADQHKHSGSAVAEEPAMHLEGPLQSYNLCDRNPGHSATAISLGAPQSHLVWFRQVLTRHTVAEAARSRISTSQPALDCEVSLTRQKTFPSPERPQCPTNHNDRPSHRKSLHSGLRRLGCLSEVHI